MREEFKINVLHAKVHRFQTEKYCQKYIFTTQQCLLSHCIECIVTGFKHSVLETCQDITREKNIKTLIPC